MPARPALTSERPEADLHPSTLLGVALSEVEGQVGPGGPKGPPLRIPNTGRVGWVQFEQRGTDFSDSYASWSCAKRTDRCALSLSLLPGCRSGWYRNASSRNTLRSSPSVKSSLIGAPIRTKASNASRWRDESVRRGRAGFAGGVASGADAESHTEGAGLGLMSVDSRRKILGVAKRAADRDEVTGSSGS
jgi:hypothetical protein